MRDRAWQATSLVDVAVRHYATTNPLAAPARYGAHLAAALVLSCLACWRSRHSPQSDVAAAATSDIHRPSGSPGRLDTGAIATTDDAASQTHCGSGPLLFISPERPVQGVPLRVLAVMREPGDGILRLDAVQDAETSERTPEGDGPPYMWMLSVLDPTAGKRRASWTNSAACGGDTLATLDFTVAPSPRPPVRRPFRRGLWTTRRAWSRAYEDLYSAWVQHLFHAPENVLPTWGALDEVLSDRSRNFLFNHLGTAEDAQIGAVRPDCADLPYFLRAYFSFKLGLPFGWSRCSRGDSTSPPLCTTFATNETPFPDADGGPATRPLWADPDRVLPASRDNDAWRFGEWLRTTLADAVQSGAGRARAEDEENDYYPVALSRESLEPGTIFADPYGHVLVIASRIDQSASSAGALFAVDAQPDGTVARKRFWRGNFLFVIDPLLGSAGFKRFRPILLDRVNGQLRRAINSELVDYSSTDQYSAGVDGFYDKVEDLLSPDPLEALQALLTTVQALDEQVRARVVSVENGRKFLAGSPPVVSMPDGEKIFETVGPWEDFATPSRDLRLLIAIDVALGMPQTVSRRPQRFRYRDDHGARLDIALQAALASELSARHFSYVRSDGSEWRLSLQDIVDRQTTLEMAYNPNDCVEIRWGARAESEEAATCRAHAPSEQLAKMESYRAWFHERRRPAR